MLVPQVPPFFVGIHCLPFPIQKLKRNGKYQVHGGTSSQNFLFRESGGNITSTKTTAFTIPTLWHRIHHSFSCWSWGWQFIFWVFLMNKGISSVIFRVAYIFTILQTISVDNTLVLHISDLLKSRPWRCLLKWPYT